MNIDRRLHHAARELREVSIEAPPFAEVRSRRTVSHRFPVLVAPVLFVLGGLIVVSGVTGGLVQPGEQPVAAQAAEAQVAAPQDGPTAAGPTDPTRRTLSALDELALINSLGGSGAGDTPPAPLRPPRGAS